MAEFEETTKKRLDELKRLIEHHNKLYYDQATPEISDAEYDQLFRELEQLEAELGDQSLSQSVGGNFIGEQQNNMYPKIKASTKLTAFENNKKVINEFPDIKASTKLTAFENKAHLSPMLSINDAFDKEELEKFYQRTVKFGVSECFGIEPKIDGVALNLIYQQGELVSALTRGDGERGDDVTQNALTIVEIPRKLVGTQIPNVIEIRGEVYMSEKNFKTLNEARNRAEMQHFANPRNATAGTLKLLDSAKVEKRSLQFVVYGIGKVEGTSFVDDTTMRSQFKEWGFPINHYYHICRNFEAIEQAIAELEQQRHELPFGTDGAVVKLLSHLEREKLGATAKAPRWAVAFKYLPEQKESRVLDITIQVGRTGVLTPVAELEPVWVAGSIIARATLHNEDIIKHKDIRIGDYVVVEKAGDIIPSIVNVLKEKRAEGLAEFNFQNFVNGVCPACQGTILKEKVAWRCINVNCSAQLVNRLEQLASKRALDIQELGVARAEALVREGKVTKVLDVFNLSVAELKTLKITDKKTSLKQEETAFFSETFEEKKVKKYVFLGEKNATKIASSLSQAKKQKPLVSWLVGLGIARVGLVGAKELARLHTKFSDLQQSPILQKLAELSDEVENWSKETHPKIKKVSLVESLREFKDKYTIKPALGSVTVKAILTYMSSRDGMGIIRQFNSWGIDPQSNCYNPHPKHKKGILFLNKSFVITGKLSKPRGSIVERIEIAGGKVLSAVSGKVDYLIQGGEEKSSKWKEAQKLGINIISENQLEKLLNQQQNSDQINFRLPLFDEW